MATELTVEAVVTTTPKLHIEAGGAAAAAAAPSSPMRARAAQGGVSHNETANNDTMANGDLQSTPSPLKEEIFEDPPLVKTDRFGFTGGKQFTDDEDVNVPVEVIRRREIKWLDMLDDWEKWMTKKPKKVRERCRKGIPSSIRSRAWQYLCGSRKLLEQNKQRWKELDEMEGQHKWVEIISKDLNRQFPFHEMFSKRGGHGQQDLFRMLKAYSIYNPRDGYCQGQAPVAAVLLMNMPVEEAFWCFVQVCDKYLTGYYSPGLEAVQVDGQVLQGLLKKVLPTTSKHMNKHKVEPILYVTEWFMCVYARTLPWRSVLRVWDMFLCEGVKVIFRVALVLLKHTLGKPEQMAESEGLYEIMEKLKNIPPELMDDEFIQEEMLKLNVFEKDLEAEHSLQVARRQVIKQRQTEREGQSTIMSRDIEAIQQRQKNAKKRKAEDSPKKGTPQKSASKMKTTDSGVKSGTNGQGVKSTIISVKPASPAEGDNTSSHMQDTNGTSEHKVPPQGENGTPHHRVPPPLPPGVVLEEEPEKKLGKSKNKKSSQKEEKEREKARLKEMKQKEKEERQKHKAQFKTTKNESKEKEKAEKVKEKEKIEKEKAEKAKQKAEKEKAKAEKARLEREKVEKAKAEKAKAKDNKGKKEKKSQNKVESADDVNGEKPAEPQESVAIQGGGTLQTLETQKEEYVHLSDVKDAPSAMEGNGHVIQEKSDDVAVTEQGQGEHKVDSEEQETKKVDAEEDAEEPTLLPGVRRIEVQEAAEHSTTDNTEVNASNIPTETDIDATETDVVADSVQCEDKTEPADESLETCNNVPKVEEKNATETEMETKIEDVVDVKEEQVADLEEQKENGSNGKEDGLDGDGGKSDVTVKGESEDGPEEDAPSKTSTEKPEVEKGDGNSKEETETHIDDAENVVVEDLDDPQPKGVTSL